MSIYKEAISSNRLFKEFDKLADFENVSKADIDQLKAMVLDVAEKIGPHLDWIKITFRQYTAHDIQHLLNIADHIFDFLPRGKGKKSHVPLNAIADEVGTPVWVYSVSAMRRRYRALAAALAEAGLDADIHYAMKANDRLAVLRLFAAAGAGADIAISVVAGLPRSARSQPQLRKPGGL